MNFRWMEKLSQWESRLEESSRSEKQLVAEVHRLNDERSRLHLAIQNLSADKQALQIKVSSPFQPWCLEIHSAM